MLSLGVSLLASLAGAGGAHAAGPPQILSTAVDGVTATSVTLRGSVNPNGAVTTYRFEYISEAAYEANLDAKPPREPFAGASLAPIGGSGGLDSGNAPVSASQPIRSLPAATSYMYRLSVSHSAEAPVLSVARPFGTEEATNSFELLDHRGWEMVSPIEKDGGAVQPPGAVSDGGVFQAASQGGSFTYSSADSFGTGSAGTPAGSQYLAARGGAGWESTNITTPLLSGSYGSDPDGVPYQLFSSDLGSALLSNGERCRGVAGGECPVANSPLPDTDAPDGYRDYYLRGAGQFQSLLTAADLSHSALGSDEFELRLVAATPDLAHVLLSSCAALTATATESPVAGGCDEADQNLYEWSGGQLTQVNLLPGDAVGSPGARIAAPAGAISADGTRVYWTEAGNLYLREGGQTRQVDAAQGGGGEFQVASSDGKTAYFVDGDDLYRYSAATGTATSLATGVEGVLGASEDGLTVYYLTSAGLFIRSGLTNTEIASAADAVDYPPATGAARVSGDGKHLLFTAAAELTGYPNEGASEVFLYGPPPGGGPATLSCVSCNPTGEAPEGGASVPGARANGVGPLAVDAYKPRALAASGNRVFFESADALSSRDSNHRTDVYEWEAAGEGTCTRAGGCVQLVSGGNGPDASVLLDADSDGSEAFFFTTASLYPLDPGVGDVYVARIGGGIAVPEQPIPCNADACQSLPEAPEDPVPPTLVAGLGNPRLKIAGARHPKHRKKKGHRTAKHHVHKGHRR